MDWDRYAAKETRLVPMIRLGEALNEVGEKALHCLYIYSSNPAITSPNQNLVRRGLAREDLFTVVHERFMTDTARYADIVLPATTSLEHDDLYNSYGHYTIGCGWRAIAPVGESKSNWEVMRLLAGAMGIDHPVFTCSERELIAHMLADTTLTEEEIVEAGDFSYGACVFFDGKTKYINRLNDKVKDNENFAYLEVVNIETIFPNRYVIHVAEREEVYAYQNGEEVYILDDDLRVLRKENGDYLSTKSNAIELKNLSILNPEVKVGDFLNVEQAGLLNMYNAFLANNRTLEEQKGFVKEIEFGESHVDVTNRDYISAKIVTHSGREFVVNNIDFALVNKIQLMFALDSTLFNQINEEGYLVDSEGNIVYDKVLNENGEIVTDENGEPLKGEVWTYERLQNSYVVIDNFILNDYQETSVTDIFYNLVDKQVNKF